MCYILDEMCSLWVKMCYILDEMCSLWVKMCYILGKMCYILSDLQLFLYAMR